MRKLTKKRLPEPWSHVGGLNVRIRQLEKNEKIPEKLEKGFRSATDRHLLVPGGRPTGYRLKDYYPGIVKGSNSVVLGAFKIDSIGKEKGMIGFGTANPKRVKFAVDYKGGKKTGRQWKLWELQTVYVEPKYRRHGLATRLLSNLLRAGMRKNWKVVGKGKGRRVVRRTVYDGAIVTHMFPETQKLAEKVEKHGTRLGGKISSLQVESGEAVTIPGKPWKRIYIRKGRVLKPGESKKGARVLRFKQLLIGVRSNRELGISPAKGVWERDQMTQKPRKPHHR